MSHNLRMTTLRKRSRARNPSSSPRNVKTTPKHQRTAAMALSAADQADLNYSRDLITDEVSNDLWTHISENMQDNHAQNARGQGRAAVLVVANNAANAHIQEYTALNIAAPAVIAVRDEIVAEALDDTAVAQLRGEWALLSSENGRTNAHRIAAALIANPVGSPRTVKAAFCQVVENEGLMDQNGLGALTTVDGRRGAVDGMRVFFHKHSRPVNTNDPLSVAQSPTAVTLVRNADLLTLAQAIRHADPTKRAFRRNLNSVAAQLVRRLNDHMAFVDGSVNTLGRVVGDAFCNHLRAELEW